MADPKQTQEPTLLRVLDQLKMSNELVTGHSVKTSRMFETEFKEERKKRSDVGKHHKKRDKVDADNKKKEDEKGKENKKQSKILNGLVALGQFAKKEMLKAAKLAKMAAGKVKDFAKDKIEGVKKAASSLLDILKKGLGLAALFMIFELIKNIDLVALWESTKKFATNIKDAALRIAEIGVALFDAMMFVFPLVTAMGAWIGIEKIKALFTGKEGSLTKKIKSMKDTIKLWFTMAKESKFITGLKNSKFLTQLTGKDSFFSKIKNLFGKIGSLFGKIPGVEKILKFVKGAGKLLGKIFVPVTVIMALWEAVTGFMDGFANTEGNMFQKIMGGIGGAIKSLLDFFVFGIAEMVQDVIIWLLELFGFDGAATAVGDFNLVQKIKDIAFGIIDWFTSIFQDPLAALGVLWDTMTGGYATIMDLLWSPVKAGIAWMLRLFGWDEAAAATEAFSIEGFINGIFDTIKGWFTGLFAWGMAAGETEDGAWSIMTFINSVIKTVKGWVTGLFSWASSEDEEDSFIMSTIKKTITGVKEWFGKMFKFDSASNILASYINLLTFFPNMIKDAIAAVTTYLLKLFGFDEAAEKVANANKFSIGEMIMKLLDTLVVWLSDLFNFDIKKIMAESLGALGAAGTKVLGWLGFGDDAKVGDNRQAGGPVTKGNAVMVGEAGPELFVPSMGGKIIPNTKTEQMTSGGGGGGMVSAPTTIVTTNNSSSSGMTIASSSIDPMHAKYFRS